MKQGEEEAWARLVADDPSDVCRRAGVEFSETTGSYALQCFTDEVVVDVGARKISGRSENADRLLTRFRYFSQLSILHYLTGAKDLVPSGRWVKPADLKGGQLYYQGSHQLPLNAIAGKYGHNLTGFSDRLAALGGVPAEFGDVSAVLHPLPKIPVALILWGADDEFAARADLMFDSTCELQLPQDIVWAVAMLTVLTAI